MRRIQLAPPPAEELVLESGGSTGSTARVAVLFANGAFGVWELDQQLDLTPVRRPLVEKVRQYMQYRQYSFGEVESPLPFESTCGAIASPMPLRSAGNQA